MKKILLLSLMTSSALMLNACVPADAPSNTQMVPIYPQGDTAHMMANTARGYAVKHHGVEILSYGISTERSGDALTQLKKLSSQPNTAGEVVLIVREHGRDGQRKVMKVWHTDNLSLIEVTHAANQYIKEGNFIRVEFFKNANDKDLFIKEIKAKST